MSDSLVRNLTFWGKTPVDGGEHPKPLLHHLIDVAAVARVFLDAQPRFSNRLAGLLCIPQATTDPLLALVVSPVMV